ncbi:GFA family protein [Altericroceibacterium xinjiangense]|uniref:GFA family protein n=1 Tax=Altericroceibacterium xinjiangense TaxID=762261 RepID=UPI000F7EBCF6|nr:GFA family protein [Altericroceibacterium xinjiangense]
MSGSATQAPTSGKHGGSCHCGTVRFTVDLPADPRPRRCNCSICAMKGVVMIDVPLGALSVTQGEDALTLYTFHSGEAKHRFCSRCGIHTFHQTRSDPDKYGINAACLEGFSPYDWAEVPVFDGQNHPVDGGTSRYAGMMRYEPEG